MRLIILAAGSGRRLGALAEGKPKCMVPLHGRPLIDWLLSSVRAAGITDVVMVRGFAAEKLTPEGVHLAFNPRYSETNMVYSLWCARDFFADPFILSYADILYEPDVLRSLVSESVDIGVALDQHWLPYWSRRFSDPLSDAETLRLDARGNIAEIGAKAHETADVAGGYIGLIKFSGRGIDALLASINASRDGARIRNRDFETLYMTDLLQMMCDSGAKLRPVYVRRGWFEIDTPQDHALAERLMRPDSSAAAGFRIVE